MKGGIGYRCMGGGRCQKEKLLCSSAVAASSRVVVAEPSRELSEPVNSENDVTSGSLALKANEETLKQEIVPVCYYLKLFESLWVRTTRRPPQLLP